ncbi:MAG TPA: hypothetical protein V6C88_17215 [Chroococcidiopsis sp.]
MVCPISGVTLQLFPIYPPRFIVLALLLEFRGEMAALSAALIWAIASYL